MATFHCPARGVCGTMVGQRQLSIAPGMACEVQWLGILSNSCILKKRFDLACGQPFTARYSLTSMINLSQKQCYVSLKHMLLWLYTALLTRNGLAVRCLYGSMVIDTRVSILCWRFAFGEDSTRRTAQLWQPGAQTTPSQFLFCSRLKKPVM